MTLFGTKPRAPVPGGRCKGTLLVNLRSFVTTTRNTEAWDRIVGASSSDDKDVLKQPLLVSSWYPVGVWNRTLRSHVKTTADPSAEIKKVARYIADRDLNTVLKFALSIAMPDTIVARTGMFWSRYFETGTLSPKMVKPREWVLTINGPIGEDDGPSAMNCGDGVSGWVEQALVLAGAVAPKVIHQRCRFRGASECKSDVVW
jgi:hypothetical protein